MQDLKYKLVLEEEDIKNYGKYLLDHMIELMGVPSNPKLPEIKEHPWAEETSVCYSEDKGNEQTNAQP